MAILRESFVEIVAESRLQEPILFNSGVDIVIETVSDFDFKSMKDYHYDTSRLEKHSDIDLGRLLHCYSRRLVTALYFCNCDFEEQDNDPRLVAAASFGKAGRIANLVSDRSNHNKAKWAVRSYLSRRRAADTYEALSHYDADRLLSLVYAADTSLSLLECLTNGRISIERFPSGYGTKEKLRDMATDSLSVAILMVDGNLDIFSPRARLNRFYRNVLTRYNLQLDADLVREVLNRQGVAGQIGA